MVIIKRIFKLLSCLFLLAIAGVFYYHSTRISPVTNRVERLFEMASTASPAQFRDTMLHPGLAKAGDPLQIARYFKLLAARTGQYVRPARGRAQFTIKPLQGDTHYAVDGTLEFEKCIVNIQLGFLGDRLAEFMVPDRRMSAELNPLLDSPPEDTAPYAALAEKFLRAVIEQRPDEAFAMCRADFQQHFGQEGFAKATRQFEGIKLEAMELLHARQRRDIPQKLDVLFKTRARLGDKVEEGKAHVTFEFQNVKSGLVGFRIPSDLE